MPSPVSYKQVLDSNGAFIGVELWQGNQYITISLEPKGTHENGYRWVEITDIVATIQRSVQRDIESNTGEVGKLIKQMKDGWENAPETTTPKPKAP